MMRRRARRKASVRRVATTTRPVGGEGTGLCYVILTFLLWKKKKPTRVLPGSREIRVIEFID